MQIFLNPRIFGSAEGGGRGFLFARGDRDEGFQAAHVCGLVDGGGASGFRGYRISVAVVARSETLRKISTAGIVKFGR